VYEKMGSPRYPTPEQIRKLREASELPAFEPLGANNGKLTLVLPAQGLAVVELK
jgi:xylan 1,4-beta-xylosidase